MKVFSDADQAGCQESRRSTRGYCVFLGPNWISWCAKKEPKVARSIFSLCATAAAELTWIQHLLCDLQVHLSSPISAYCDNIGALYLAHNPVLHSRMKHLTFDYHLSLHSFKSSFGGLKSIYLLKKRLLISSKNPFNPNGLRTFYQAIFTFVLTVQIEGGSQAIFTLIVFSLYMSFSYVIYTCVSYVLSKNTHTGNLRSNPSNNMIICS